MVHESIKQTRARYTLAEMARKESDMRKRLEKLRAHEESLLQPPRLSAMAKELSLDVASLGTVPPEESGRGGKAASRRRPGEYADPDEGKPLQMASADRR